uniref:PHD-type domain-containing protein n=2 Tax=Kryptolebias marmoratus TaxID=37003 RepID=A0A3Q2Z9U5_KRYMA
MDEQKSNCEENDSEPTADDSASANQPVSPKESSKASRAVEDESGDAAASSSTPIESARACALCNCVERSLHGQRELQHFRSSSQRPPLKPSAFPLPEPGNDDLSSIGFSDSSCLTALFDDSGGCWVHHWCAVWSEEVKQTEDEELENVDKAVISGTQRLCDYCKRLGATIRCHIEDCSRFYHFPCSAASGSFQSMKQLVLLCPEHIHKAEELAGEEAWCAVCDSVGELTELLFCTGCGLHYHATCLEIGATPIQRAGWQCPECKVCQTCRQPGEDSKMLVCDACDKGYHTFCLQPPMDSLPSDPWKCRRCRVCLECGARGLVLPGSAQWFENYSVCEGCQHQRSSVCCVCSKAANPSVGLHCCSICHRWMHSECVSSGEFPEAKVVCLLCKEDQQQPVAQTVELQAGEEMTIQAKTDTFTEKRADSSEVTSGQKGTSGVDAAQNKPEKETLMDLGVESAAHTRTCLETTTKGESQLAAEGFTCETPAAPLVSKERGEPCFPADEERLSQKAQATLSQDLTTETQPNKKPTIQPTIVSHQDPENMELGNEEEKQKATLTAGQEPSQKLIKNGSDDTSNEELLRKDSQKSSDFSVSESKTELLSMDDKFEGRGTNFSPSPTLSQSADSHDPLSAMNMERRLLPHSDDEEEEEEEDDYEQMKGHDIDIKQEFQGVKPELLLDEMSNMSHGDESSSGFLGSPGEPDPQLSMELGFGPAGHLHTDNLTETDDSLPFEPLRSDREKAKRRGSPGRSRVKQGRSSSFPGKRRPRGGGGG